MKNGNRQLAARILQALGHPLRLGAVQELQHGEKTFKDLQTALDCGQSMLSQQLKILEQYGLIQTRKEGTLKFCRLANPELLKLFACLDRHIAQLTASNAKSK